MSDPEEHVEPQKVEASTASTADSEPTADVISIPRPSEEAEESDISVEQESETEALTTESEETTEVPSERSTSTAKSSEAKPREEVVSAENVPQPWEERKSPESQSPEEEPLLFLNEIKSIKETLQATIRESLATGSSCRRPDILLLDFKG